MTKSIKIMSKNRIGSYNLKIGTNQYVLVLYKYEDYVYIYSIYLDNFEKLRSFLIIDFFEKSQIFVFSDNCKGSQV